MPKREIEPNAQVAEQKDLLAKLMLQVNSLKGSFAEMANLNKAETQELFERVFSQLKTLAGLATQNLKFWELGVKSNSVGAHRPDPNAWLLPATVLFGYIGCMANLIVLMRKLFAKLASLKSSLARSE